MKICMMSLMMTDVFTHNYPIEEILEVASHCGMGAVDWIGLHNTTSKVLKKASDAAGIPIAAHTMLKDAFIKDDPNYMDDFKSSLEDACIMGAPVLMLPPFARAAQSSMADDRKRYIDYFGQAEELARKAGVQLTLESTGFENSPISTADECLEILNAVPGLRVTYDVGNVFTAEDPLAAYRKLRKYVVHFHVKDWFVSSAPKEGYTKKRNGTWMGNALLGDGDVKLREFWQETTAEERQIWVNPESCDFSDKRDPKEVFTEICRRMRSWED